MRISTIPTTDGGAVRELELEGPVPGRLWHGITTTAAPLILLAHGGGQDSGHPAVVGKAHRFVEADYAVLALDAPGHGTRHRDPGTEALMAELRAATGDVRRTTEAVAALDLLVAARAAPEWRDALDRLDGSDLPVDLSWVGFWGVSMGAAVGLALIPDEPRVRAATLGLIGRREGAASRIGIPVQFLMQWDDQLVPRDAALRLFDAFAGPKTLHANPGPHQDLPRFETIESIRFFDRQVRHPG